MSIWTVQSRQLEQASLEGTTKELILEIGKLEDSRTRKVAKETEKGDEKPGGEGTLNVSSIGHSTTLQNSLGMGVCLLRKPGSQTGREAVRIAQERWACDGATMVGERDFDLGNETQSSLTIYLRCRFFRSCHCF